MTELYQKMTNLLSQDIESSIKECIRKTKTELEKLTLERTCFIYSSCLYQNLRQQHIPAKMMDTESFGLSYQHYFVLVPKNEQMYLLDLTYKQFPICEEEREKFNPLLEKGYQEMNNDLWPDYLQTIAKASKNARTKRDSNRIQK